MMSNQHERGRRWNSSWSSPPPPSPSPSSQSPPPSSSTSSFGRYANLQVLVVGNVCGISNSQSFECEKQLFKGVYCGELRRTLLSPCLFKTVHLSHTGDRGTIQPFLVVIYRDKKLGHTVARVAVIHTPSKAESTLPRCRLSILICSTPGGDDWQWHSGMFAPQHLKWMNGLIDNTTELKPVIKLPACFSSTATCNVW